MEKENLTQKIAFNTIVQVVGKIITAILSIILVAYLTRYLGIFGFGEYTTVYVYLSFWGVLADFGFFNILVREISKNPQNEEKIANNLLTFRAFFAIGIYLLGLAVSLFLPYSLTIKTGILLITLATFFGTQNSSLVGIFQARHRMDKSVLSDVLGRAAILGSSIYFIHQNYSIEYIFLAAILGNLLNLIISWLLISPYVHLKFAFDFKLWKKIFIEAWPLGISAIFSIIYFKLDSVMLSLMKGSEDVGIYGAPYKVLESLLLIPAIFMGNVFPVLSRYFKENNQKIKNIVQKAFDFLTLTGTGMFFGGFILSEKIIYLLAGQTFVTASTMSFLGYPITAPILFEILLFAMALSYMSFTFGYIIIAADKQLSLIKPTFFATLLNLGLNLLLIPKYGYLAAATTTVVTELFILIYQALLAKKAINFLPQFHNFFKIILSGLIMAIILRLLIGLDIILLIIIGILIYLFLLYILKVITKDALTAVIRGDKE